MDSFSPEELVRQNLDRLALPETAQRINEMVNDPRCGVATIAAAVAEDGDLRDRILRIVNSPFYGLGSEVASIDQAVTLLGVRQLRDLVLATTVMRRFQELPVDLVKADSFWRHNLATGMLAHALAGRIGAGQRGRYLLAGLLHDVGQLVACLLLPDAARQVQRHMAETPEADREQVEQDIFGFDHAALGAALLRQWRVPESVVQAVLHHHRPEAAAEFAQEASVLYLASILADSVQARPGRQPVQTAPRACEMLGFSPERLAEVRAAVDGEMQHSMELLYSGLAA